MDLTLEKFELTEPKEVFACRVFKVMERTATTPDKAHCADMFMLRCSNWVNIVPVTADGKIVLVEQHRFGTDTLTLETPGGAVDPHEKDFTMSALRELEEETGLTTQRMLALPGFPPNPAIQNNRITYFVAFDCQPLAQPRDANDLFEQIKLHYVDVKEALQMARTGQINHALAALALLLAEPLLARRYGPF